VLGMKGCLLRLALLPLIVAVVYALLSIREPFPTFIFPAEDAEVAAPVAGLLFWFAALYLLDARQARANLALALQSLGRGLRDGEKAVVYGVLEARGPLLEAPFTGETCVAYEYRVSHRRPEMKGPQVDCQGHALTATAVRGPMGSLTILAPADKEVFHEVPFEPLRADEAFTRAESYLSGIDFGEPGGLFKDVSRRETVDGPGRFRMDLKSGTKTDLRSCDLEQKVLRPGDEVSVAGVYSERERGIGPHPDTILQPFHIVPGGEAALARKIRSRRIGAVVCTLLGLTVVAVYLLVAAASPS